MQLGFFRVRVCIFTNFKRFIVQSKYTIKMSNSAVINYLEMEIPWNSDQ